MPSIGLIDDRADQRDTVALRLRRRLPDDWALIDIGPLPEASHYVSWVAENEVRALVLDERLSEQIVEGAGAIDYAGHDIVERIRAHHPTMPIFVLTSFPDDEDVKARFGDVEEVIARRAFAPLADQYAARILRAASRYSEEHEGELAQLGLLAEQIATGSATDRTVHEAEALRTKLAIAFPLQEMKERSVWLNEIGSKLEEMNALLEQAERNALDKD